MHKTVQTSGSHRDHKPDRSEMAGLANVQEKSALKKVFFLGSTIELSQ